MRPTAILCHIILHSYTKHISLYYSTDAITDIFYYVSYIFFCVCEKQNENHSMFLRVAQCKFLNRPVLSTTILTYNKIYAHVRITRRYLRTSVLRINQAGPFASVSFAPIKPGWYVTRVIFTDTYCRSFRDLDCLIFDSVRGLISCQ